MKLKRAMLYILLIIVGFTFISVWYFYQAIQPLKILLNRQPIEFGLPSERIVLKTADGLGLSGWFIKGQRPSAPAVILIHGYPSEKSDMLGIAKALWPDFSVLVFDLRYFGQSEGQYTTLGVKEKLDLKAALDFLQTKGFTKIGVFGVSLGGAVGIMTAAEDKRINAAASYASFYNLQLLGEDVYRHFLFLKRPLVELMLLWSRLFFKESLKQVSPENAVKNLSIPILIMHNQKDEQIPFTHGLLLKSALSGNSQAEFYFSEEGLHQELPRDLESQIKKFFQKTLE